MRAKGTTKRKRESKGEREEEREHLRAGESGGIEGWKSKRVGKRKRERTKGLLLTLCYLFILVATCWAEYVSYHIPMGQDRINEWNILKFFTNDSNILLAFSCLMALPSSLQGKGMGRGVFCLRFVATVGTALTFWTVLLFLGPVFGYANMYHHEDFYLHAIGPVLTFLLFTFVEQEKKVRRWEVLLSALPMALYGAVYAYMVVFTGKWLDFYGFVATGHWALVYAGMLLVTLLLGLLHAWMHNRFWKGKEKMGE